MEGNASMEHSHDGEHALEALEPDKPVQQGGSHDAEAMCNMHWCLIFLLQNLNFLYAFLIKKK